MIWMEEAWLWHETTQGEKKMHGNNFKIKTYKLSYTEVSSMQQTQSKTQTVLSQEEWCMEN